MTKSYYGTASEKKALLSSDNSSGSSSFSSTIINMPSKSPAELEKELCVLVTGFGLDQWLAYFPAGSNDAEGTDCIISPQTGVIYNLTTGNITIPPQNHKLNAYRVILVVCALLGCTSGGAGFKNGDIQGALFSITGTLFLNLSGALRASTIPGLKQCIFPAILALQSAAQAFEGAGLISGLPYQVAAATGNLGISTAFNVNTFRDLSQQGKENNQVMSRFSELGRLLIHQVLALLSLFSVITTAARATPLIGIMEDILPLPTNSSYALTESRYVGGIVGIPLVTSIAGFAMFYGSLLMLLTAAMELAKNIINRNNAAFQGHLTISNILTFAIVGFCVYNGFLNYQGLAEKFLEKYLPELNSYCATVLACIAGFTNGVNNLIRFPSLKVALEKLGRIILRTRQTQQAHLERLNSFIGSHAITHDLRKTLAGYFRTVGLPPPPVVTPRTLEPDLVALTPISNPPSPEEPQCVAANTAGAAATVVRDPKRKLQMPSLTCDSEA